MADTQSKPQITAKEIQAKLEANGIRPGCGCKGYERAKSVVIGGQWLDDSNDYNRIIAMICEYIGI